MINATSHRNGTSHAHDRPARTAWPLAMSFLLILATSTPAAGVDVPVSVAVQGDGALIGQDLVLAVTLTLPAGTSLAAEGLTIDVSATDGAEFLAEPYPVKLLSADETGVAPAAYSGRVAFEWAAPVPADAKPLTTELRVDVSGRTPAGDPLRGSWQGELTVDFGEEWSADRIQAFIEDRGFAFFLALVFGFGLLMSLSPCIYPMIPITLAVIGASSQEKGALHGLIMSVTYVIGMALVYAVLGALSATIFSGITAFMQSPAVLVPLALLLVALSFSMFGAYELQAPAFLRDRLAGPGGSRGGLIGAFAMGLVAGLVASPCVGPFLFALLAWVATTGDWVWGFLSLFTFGIGMGMLLIGVGTFPALLGGLPRSGGWMETVKKGMGLLLVAMAFYFVRPGAVFPPHVFYPLLGVTTIVVAVFVGAFDRIAADSGWWLRTAKGLGLVTFAAGLYFLAGSFLQHGFIMPSPLSPTAAVPAVVEPTTRAVQSSATAVEIGEPKLVEPVPAKVPWQKIHTGDNVQAFLDEQLAAAKAAGRPVMIDFWAEWCVYCKKLDKSVWNVPDVVTESLRFTTIKIDATEPDDADMESVKETLQVVGLPRVVFVDSRGEVLHGRSAGYKPAPEMLELMRSIR